MKLLCCLLFVFSLAVQGALVEKNFPAKIQNVHIYQGDTFCEYTLAEKFDQFPIVKYFYISYGHCAKEGKKYGPGSCDEVGFRRVSEFKSENGIFVSGMKPPYTLVIGGPSEVIYYSYLGITCKPRTFKIVLEQ
jgi:hypothetical protein